MLYCTILEETDLIYYIIQLEGEDEVLIPNSSRVLESHQIPDKVTVGEFQERIKERLKILRIPRSEIEARANEIVAPYGLTAMVPPEIRSVGVQGDNRTYLPIVCLFGPFPGYATLDKLSSEITNTLPVNRVTIEIKTKK